MAIFEIEALAVVAGLCLGPETRFEVPHPGPQPRCRNEEIEGAHQGLAIPLAVHRFETALYQPLEAGRLQQGSWLLCAGFLEEVIDLGVVHPEGTNGAQAAPRRQCLPEQDSVDSSSRGPRNDVYGGRHPRLLQDGGPGIRLRPLSTPTRADHPVELIDDAVYVDGK